MVKLRMFSRDYIFTWPQSALTPTLPVFRGQIGCCMDRVHGPKQPIRRQEWLVTLR